MNGRVASILLAFIIIGQTPLFPALQEPASAAPAPSPVKWQKYASNPVLSLGPNGAFDDVYIMTQSVIKDGNAYKLYYGANDGSYRSIGLATSNDGKSWSKYSGNPILRGEGAGSWSSVGVYAPFVLKESGVYNMWFIGSDGSHSRMGFASSTDGISFYRYSGNPVLAPGASGAWDSYTINMPAVVHESGVYKLWYSGNGYSHERIGYATSSDGLSWTKYAQNPVMDLGGSGAWDDETVSSPCVLNVSGTLRMWYGGYSGTNYAIGHATSDDGVTWAKYAHNPVMSKKSGFESGHNLCPVVLYDAALYRMWYTGASTTWSTYGVGYAEGLNQLPYAPTLVSPYDNEWAPTSPPRFSWWFRDPDQYDTQTAFRLQLDKDFYFYSVEYDSGKNLSTFSYHTPDAPVADGAYYWRVMTWDSDGDNSTWSYPWKVNIDRTAPLNPVGLFSPSHTVGKWSNKNTITVNWSLPENGAEISGYDGFSIQWDSFGTSVPDPIPDLTADNLSTTSPPLPDGDGYYFHIRAKDGAGNWAGGAAHLGPFRIDASPPQNPAEVSCLSHQTMVWSSDNTPEITWSEADGSISGPEG